MDNKFHIAYAIENQHIAKDIDNNLSRVGIELDHIMVTNSPDESPLRERLKDLPNFIMLLVSDNLLKNPNAMGRGLFMLQELMLNQKVQPIIIDGRQINEETGVYNNVPTVFERMTNVIKYMNYWQDYYLELRKERREIPTEDLEPFDEKLKVVRSISSEMGDFLKTLKNNSHWNYAEFTHDGFAMFFQAINKPGLHDALKTAIANGEIPPPTLPMNEAPVAKKTIMPPPVEPVANNEITTPQVVTPPISETPPVETKSSITEAIKTTAPIATAASIISSQAKKAEVDFSKQDIPEIPKEKPTVVEPVAKTTEITPPITTKSDPITDGEILKISEDKIKKQGRVPLLDKLIEHRKENEKLAANPPKESRVVKVISEKIDNRTATPIKKEDQVFEKAVDNIIKEEKKIEETPKPKAIIKKNPILGSIFHDDDAELDSDEMIGSFELSSSRKKGQNSNWETKLASAEKMIKSGKLYAGLNVIREIVDKNRSNAKLRYTYAVHLMDGAQSYKAAKRELEKVVSIEGNNIDAYVRLATLAEKKEDYLLAKSYYEKALELDNDNANLHHRIGILIATRFPDFQDQAADFFKRSLKLDDKNPDAHYRYGLILDEHLKKPKKAIRHFEITLEIQPDHPFVNYDLALMHYRFGQFKKAADAYLQACAINSEFKTETNDRAFLGALKTADPSIATSLDDLFQDLSDSSKENIIEKRGPEIHTFTEAKPQKNSNAEKVVLVSGATSGIGHATANIFASNGYRVIITGRRTDRLAAIKSDFEKKYNTEIETLEFDVRDIDAAQAAIASLDDRWNSIDILINNAGLAKGFDPIHEGKLEDWETMIDTNVKGLLYLTRMISPGMVARKKGHIINVCSTAGHEAYPNGNVYCATKHAVDALTKGMRLDLYKYGLRVSQVSPAHVEETEFARVRFDWDVERAKIYEDFKPLRAADVASSIYFIATQPEHVNIQDIMLMGRQQANSTNVDRSGR